MTTPAADRPPLFARRRDAKGRRRAGPPIWDRRTWKLLFSPAGAPAFVLLAVFALALVAQTGGPAPWGVSGEALAHGRWHTLVTHMATHAGLVHLLLNASALLPLTALVMVRLGVGPAGWLRFFVLFAVSGLAGAALYLAIHPAGIVPMVGASGAIFGLWGAISRIRADGSLAPLWSQQVRDEVLLVAYLNAAMFALGFALARLDGGIGGIAWEAHIGGYLFGLLAMPWLAPRTPPPASV